MAGTRIVKKAGNKKKPPPSQRITPSPITRKPPIPEPEKRKEFREQMVALKDQQLEAIECRANGHGPWNPMTVTKIRFGFHVWEKCGNCKSERERWLDRYGLVAKQSKIHYSEAFELLRGLGHNTGIRRGAARIEYLLRHDLSSIEVP